MQVKAELVPLFQEAARRAHGSAGMIANAGDHYSVSGSRGGRLLVIKEGCKGIEVAVSKPEIINFWREYEKLAKETTSLSR